MKIAFKIPPASDNNRETHLLIEAGNDDLSFLFFSINPFTVEGLISYIFEKNLTPANYAADVKNCIKDSDFLHAKNYKSCNIFYNFSTSALVPVQYFMEDEKEGILDQLFAPDKTRLCFQETCVDEGIKNIYSIPSVIHNSFVESYPACKFAHSTSSQTENNKQNEATLYCIIYNSSIKIIFFKEGQLQIVQYFDYTTPADVCYHILNVSERFDVTPSSVKLSLSGMVDVDSGLYQELYKYFLHTVFTTIDDVNFADNLTILPTHFYHHLTALAHAHN